MKEKYLFLILIMTALMLSGCGSEQGKEETQKTVQKQNSTVSQEKENTSEEKNTNNIEDTDKSSEEKSINNTDNTNNTEKTSKSKDKMITNEEAKAKALAHAKLTADKVTFVQCKLEHEDGRQVYDVEFYSHDNGEYDYDIDAYTGEVVSYDYDAEHYEHKHSTSANGSNAITEDEAKKMALNRVQGADASHIREFEKDYDDGRVEYEGKIIYNGVEYEFEIDGSNGTFIDWEEEPAD